MPNNKISHPTYRGFSLRKCWQLRFRSEEEKEFQKKIIDEAIAYYRERGEEKISVEGYMKRKLANAL